MRNPMVLPGGAATGASGALFDIGQPFRRGPLLNSIAEKPAGARRRSALAQRSQNIALSGLGVLQTSQTTGMGNSIND